MTWIASILEVLLRVLLPFLADRLRPKAGEAAPQPELRDRLRNRIRITWRAPTAAVLVLVLLLGPLLAGCNPRTIYVPWGEPVRLRETLPRVKIWTVDENGKPVAGVIDLPEGWFALPDPGLGPEK